MKAAAPLVGLLLLFGGCVEEAPRERAPGSSGPVPAAKAPAFGGPVKIQDTSSVGAEPGVAVHPDGALFVLVWTALHRSDDGGKTFARLTTPFQNNGDSDLAITPDGVLHYVGMTLAGQTGEPRLPYFRSSDKGATWSSAQDLGKRGNNIDRPFIEFDSGLLVLTWNDITSDENLVRTSVDLGKTWTDPRVIAAPRAKFVGAPAVHGNVVVQPFNLFDRVDVAHSTDRGATWQVRSGPPLDGRPEFMPQVAFDSAGRLYLAATLTKNAAPRILVWSTLDPAGPWGPPALLAGSTSHGVFPWIVAGAAGRAAVSFYERDVTNGAANAPWYPRVAVTNHADVGSGWTGTRVVAAPVRTKDICSGANCPADQWSFKDLFEMALTPEGRPFLAWMHEASSGPALPVVGSSSSTLSVHAAVATSGWTSHA